MPPPPPQTNPIALGFPQPQSDVQLSNADQDNLAASKLETVVDYMLDPFRAVPGSTQRKAQRLKENEGVHVVHAMKVPDESVKASEQ